MYKGVEIGMKKQVRTLGMYLPQFHRVAENDEWWGEGFTEWTTVREAEPLFEGHIQPIKPLNNNYYNLMEKGTMEWQSMLMKKYGIDGQCFYHYYFKDGRKILEKPAENLLRWKDIDMPFCFCWANDRWARTWSNARGNSWADKFEKKETAEGNGILIEQRYGREEEWKKHFEYLVPFFNDERYIKVNDAPIFLIFSPLTIPCLSQMMDYWNELARENQIQSIYFIGMNSNKYISGMNALILHAPHMVWKMEDPINGIRRIDYNQMWDRISNTETIDGQKTYYCGVPNLDDTPRRGRHDGVVFSNFSIEKFYAGMCTIYKKSIEAGNEFVFINSWNEWGEGMQLEPDEEYGYAKLEAVHNAQKDILENYQNNNKIKKSQRNMENSKNNSEKANYLITAKCFDQWMSLREKGVSVSKYLKRYNIAHVAVYGYGMLARHLLFELDETDITVDYIIDKSSRRSSLKYDVKNLEDDFPLVDAVIVTIVDEFDSIYKVLKKKINSRFFSLYEIVSEL